MNLTPRERNTIIDALRYYCGANDFESPVFFDPPPLSAYEEITALASKLSTDEGEGKRAPRSKPPHEGKKRSAGRPSLYTSKIMRLLEMREDGRTVEEITEALQIGKTAYYRWLRWWEGVDTSP